MLTQGDLAQIHDSLEAWASDGEEDGPGAGDCMRHAEVASNITKCQASYAGAFRWSFDTLIAAKGSVGCLQPEQHKSCYD